MFTDEIVVPFENALDSLLLRGNIGEKLQAPAPHSFHAIEATIRGEVLSELADLPTAATIPGSPQEPNIPMTKETRYLLRDAADRGAANLARLPPQSRRQRIDGKPTCAAALRAVELQFKPRLLALHYRQRLITLDESTHIVEILKTQTWKSNHSQVFTEKLTSMTANQAAENVGRLSSLIEECLERGLKRLEVETRLLQACFFAIARHLGHSLDFDHNQCLKRTRVLCREYPDTAGIFTDAWNHVRRVLNASMNLRVRIIFPRSASDLWHSLGEHIVGHLTQCDLGHLYSTAAFSGCPECGRRVSSSERPVTNKQAVEATMVMHENEFLVKMKELGFGADCKENITISCAGEATDDIIKPATTDVPATDPQYNIFGVHNEDFGNGLREMDFQAKMKEMGMLCT